MRINPLLLVDSYKIHHTKMYPNGMTLLYSNFTPRKSRMSGVNGVVVFGIQHFILEYLIRAFDEHFFFTREREESLNYEMSGGTQVSKIFNKEEAKARVIAEYARHCQVDTKHIEALWDLGYLPIEIKALEEGTICPIGVPMLTIKNTHPDFEHLFGWLVNYLETLLSCMLWQSVTSATIAHEYKKILTRYVKETDEKAIDFVPWQGHDFSMRGMSSVESSILSGMGHLLSFTGTDTIPAIYQLESSYDAVGLIGASVPATEHSVMCMGTKEAEIETFKRLLDLYPTGVLSVVSDTWNLWEVIKPGGYCDQLKQEIMSRDGKLVIRPDSGDPVDIICGLSTDKWKRSISQIPEQKGVIELLWEVFGGTVNEQGYKVLDSHIGAIYGDSITLERATQICERLKAKGFASTNIVLGVGSFTYQYNTRDTFGFAMKATYGEITHHTGAPDEQNPGKELLDVEAREIFKDPITDDGTKKSKKGLLRVVRHGDKLEVVDQQTWAGEAASLLTTVFKNGVLTRRTNLDEIRERLNKNL